MLLLPSRLSNQIAPQTALDLLLAGLELLTLDVKLGAAARRHGSEQVDGSCQRALTCADALDQLDHSSWAGLSRDTSQR